MCLWAHLAARHFDVVLGDAEVDAVSQVVDPLERHLVHRGRHGAAVAQEPQLVRGHTEAAVAGHLGPVSKKIKIEQ